MATELETQNDLLNFDWENSTEDFFGVTKPEEVEKKEPAKDPEKDKEPEEDKSKTPEKDKEKETEDKFSFGDEEEEDIEDKTKTPQNEGSFYGDMYKDLKDTGIFKHVQLEEGEEIDEDRFIELQEEEYETEVSQRLKSWATEELDTDAQAFIKFKRDGGSTEEFFKAFSKVTELPVGNITDEDYQDEVIRYQLSQEGWDRDEIEDRLAYLTESGKKEKMAVKYDAKVKEQVDKEKQELLKQAEVNRQKQKETEDEFKDTLKEALDETEEINGLKISAQDKIKVFNFLTKKEHKVSNTKSVTGFQKKLAETFQDTNKMILLAKLVESDFDLSGFAKEVVTKKTKEVKTNLEQRKNLRPSNSGSSLQGRSLSDLFI
jgi:hypothetical protein